MRNVREVLKSFVGTSGELGENGAPRLECVGGIREGGFREGIEEGIRSWNYY